jgi:hypothetical protein
VAEITAMQIIDPLGARKRALLLESGYPLSSLLDPAQKGYLARPPVLIGLWETEDELHDLARNCAFHVATWGRLPAVL